MKPTHAWPIVTLVAAASAFAADPQEPRRSVSAVALTELRAPTYDNAVLAIPRVDGATQVGLFQDAVLEVTSQGTLKLLQMEELGKGKVYNVGHVRSVEVKQSGTLPVGVYLQVSGELNACDFVGPARIHQRLQGAHFDVNVSALHLNPFSQVQVCAAQVSPFKVTVPLQVYGLAAGTYTYSINGVASGSFTLGVNNRFPDDCDVSKNGNCG